MEAKNIFQQILSGLEITNQNVVDLSEEIAKLREDVVTIREYMLPSPTPTGEDKVGKIKKK